MPAANLDVRPGGVFHYCLRSSDGKTMWGKFVSQIEPPERIVLVNSFSDADGNLTRHRMSPNWPLEMLATTTFTEQGGRTTVTVQWAPLNASPAEREAFNANRDGMQVGWTGTFDPLAEYLKNQQI